MKANRFNRFCVLYLGLTLLGGNAFRGPASAQSNPSTQPFPRLEAGMHTASIRRIAVDSRERFLVTASDDKSARVWDLATGKLLTIFRPPIGDDNEGKVHAVAISPDGSTIAVGGSTGKAGSKNFPIYLFDRASSRMTRRISGVPSVTNHLAFSLDGRLLAASSAGRNGVRVFRVSDGTEVWHDSDYKDGSVSIEFDHKGRLLATSYDGELRLYGPAPEFKLLAKKSAPGGSNPRYARFSPDASLIAVGFEDSTKVNVLSGEDLRFLYAPDTSQVNNGNLFSGAWSTDGNRLYAAGRFRHSNLHPVIVWPRAGRGVPQFWPAGTSPITDLRPLAKDRLVFGTSVPAWAVLDTQGKRLMGGDSPILDHRGNESRFRLARDGSSIEFRFNVWANGERQRRLARFDLRERRLEVDVSPASALSAPRTDGLDIRDWRENYKPTLNGKPLSLQQHERSWSLAIAEDGSRFVLGTDFNLRLFDPLGKKLWNKLVPGMAGSVNLSADGRFVVAALGDGTIRWYDARDGKERLALFIHSDTTRWVLFTPEGFFDASPGAESLIAYQLNQGADKEGQFIGSDQLVKVFNRSDLVIRRLEGDERPITDAVQRIGDVRTVLAAGLPPQLELLSPAQVTQSGEDFVLNFRVIDQGGGIGQIVYRINGREIEGRPEGIPPVGSGQLSRRFSLAPGRHVVSATVYNRDGKVESNPIRTEVEVKARDYKPDLYVLAVGISKYREKALEQGVRFAAEDARSITNRLQERAAGVYGRVVSEVLQNTNATVQSIEQAFSRMKEKVRPNDAFVFYLAGHGTAVDGDYHFLTWETVNTSQQALRERSLSGEKIRSLIRTVNTNKSVTLIDSCAAGAFRVKLPGRTSAEDKAAFDRLARLTGSAIIGATADDKMALEGSNGHGVFTDALLRGLGGAAKTNERGEINTGALADFIEEEVPRITQRMWKYEQFPWREMHGQTFPIGSVRSK